MIKIKELIEIINNIPNLLQYYVPGIIFIYIVKTGFSKKLSTWALNVSGCVISYVLLCISTLIRVKLSLLQSINQIYANSILSICLALVLGFAVLYLITKQSFTEFMEQYFNITLNDDIFYDVIDFKGGSKCKITLKGKDFYIIGDMDYLGDRINNDQQIVLRAYSQYKIDNDDDAFISYDDNPYAKIVIRYSDIDMMEIFNSEPETNDVSDMTDDEPENVTGNSVLDDVFDYEDGSCVIIRLKDKDYFFMGNLRMIDEGKDKQYIVLNAFTKFAQDGSVLATYAGAKGQENNK